MRKAILIAFGILVLSFPGPAAAQGTPAQRAACEQDAYRLCQQAIPDEPKVRRCLVANMRRLSPVCRTAFQRKGKAKVRRR
jgi:hypothetical protein